MGTWDGGREKAPAAVCRKIAKLKRSDQEIEVWGDGLQTRSFLHVDDCIEATRRLMKSNFMQPINIGSEEMVTINELIDIVSEIASKPVTKRYKIDAPTGVRGRNSDNRLIRSVLDWDFEINLREGLKDTYNWINQQVSKGDS
jgi:nucleoside-diphosphate-sugar epimerase